MHHLIVGIMISWNRDFLLMTSKAEFLACMALLAFLCSAVRFFSMELVPILPVVIGFGGIDVAHHAVLGRSGIVMALETIFHLGNNFLLRDELFLV